MLDFTERRLMLVSAAGVLLVVGLVGWQNRREAQASTATIRGAQLQEVAIQATAKAEVYDQAVTVQGAEARGAKATLAKSKARLANLPSAPPVPEPSPNPVAVDPELLALRAKNVAQAAVIFDQDRYIKTLELQLDTTTLSRDSWRTSAQASQAEVVQKNAVIAAQQGLIAGALLKGRLQGLAVGLGSGYLAGGLR